MHSSHEFEKMPCIVEAIDYCDKEILRLNGQIPDPDQSYDTDIIGFEEKKRRHNKKAGFVK